MPRTPALCLLLDAYRSLRGAAERGLPADEYHATRRARRAASRRDFLALWGAAAGSALLASCGGTPPPQTGRTVAIVGAGLAGLHCAYRLKKLGLRAMVYDAATSRLGGRIFTDGAWPEGQHCELGGEVIDSGHRTMLDLAQELGIPLLDYQKEDPSLGALVAHFGGAKLTDKQLLDGFKPIAARLDGALKMLRDPAAGVTYKNPNGAEGLDQYSIRQWLDSINAAGPVRTLLEVAYTAEYGMEVEQQSVLNLLALISTDTNKLALYGDADGRFHARDGNGKFIDKLAQELGEGQLQRDAQLAAVRRLADGRVNLVFNRAAGGAFDAAFDQVVLAIPFTMLRQVNLASAGLPALKQKAINELGYGTNAKLMVSYKGRPWRTAKSSGATFSDLPYQSTWEASRLQPGVSGIITNLTGGRRGIEVGEGMAEAQGANFLDQFEKLFPGSKTFYGNKTVRMHWPSAPLVKASYACYRVGQWVQLAGVEGERSENLHFCGEHTSLGAQGSMEGAAASGAAAALEVARDLGMAPPMALLSGPERRILARAAAGPSRSSLALLEVASRRRRG